MKQSINSEPTKPYTVGIIFGDLKSGYELSIYAGIRKAAQKYGITVVIYPVKPIGLEVDTRYYYPKVNEFIINHLFDPNQVDGLIVLAEVFQVFYKQPEVEALYNLFAQVPLVNIGGESLKCNRTTIDANHYDGMRQIMSHVIETCGCEGIAFIRGIIGNDSADKRFQAYQDALTDYGRPFDPQWVINGDFKSSSGEQAVGILLDDRGLKPDVIVASNDDMALGVLWALRRRGISVPDEIGLTGFDNDPDAQFYRPLLTTVQQPTYRMGYMALEAVMAHLTENSPISRIELPVRLIIRESCRYLNKERKSPATAQDFATTCRYIWHQEIGPVLIDNSPNINQAEVDELAACFLADIEGTTETTFSATFAAMVEKMPYWLSEFQLLQTGIEKLKIAVQNQLQNAAYKARAYELCYDAQMIINQLINSQHMRWQRSTRAFVDGESELLNSPSLETLNKALSVMLHRVGIQYCHISLFDSYPNPSTTPHLVIAINPQGSQVIKHKNLTFPISQHHIEPLPYNTKSRSWVVSLLHYRDEFIGLLTISMEAQVSLIYEALRIQIGYVLKLMLSIEQLRTYTYYLEEQVQNRTQDLHALLLEKQELMGIVAHDLRNPLSGIRLGASMLEAKWETMVPDKINHTLGLIDQYTERMLSIINRLLQTHQTEQETFTINPQLVVLNKLIKEVATSLEPIAASKQISLIVDLGDVDSGEKEVVVLTDPDILKQIFDNLISNAIKYSPPQTTIQIVLMRHQETWQIQVKDQGQGLTETDMSQLFGRFTRLSATPTAGESSVGLGLYITKKMAMAMGGDIYATSPGKNKGSTFIVTLSANS